MFTIKNIYKNLGKYERKLEKFYDVNIHIAEFWNTLTNIPFILIGLYNLLFYTFDWNLTVAYFLLTMCGIGSSIHHASPHKWTIVIDWIPISCSILFVLWSGIIYSISMKSLIFSIISFGILLTDHICTPISVPWGHCLWHILASIAVNSIYSDYYELNFIEFI